MGVLCMKKRFLIISIIISIIVFFAVISLIVFFTMSRMKGNIFVTVNGEQYLVENMDCKYEEVNIEKVNLKRRGDGVSFKNDGLRYGLYDYSFQINTGEINIVPQFKILKTNWWEWCGVNIYMDIYEEDNIWNAYVHAKINGDDIYEETISNIEKNGILFRY